jgi:hypothetical protein
VMSSVSSGTPQEARAGELDEGGRSIL